MKSSKIPDPQSHRTNNIIPIFHLLLTTYCKRLRQPLKRVNNSTNISLWNGEKIVLNSSRKYFTTGKILKSLSVSSWFSLSLNFISIRKRSLAISFANTGTERRASRQSTGQSTFEGMWHRRKERETHTIYILLCPSITACENMEESVWSYCKT